MYPRLGSSWIARDTYQLGLAALDAAHASPATIFDNFPFHWMICFIYYFHLCLNGNRCRGGITSIFHPLDWINERRCILYDILTAETSGSHNGVILLLSDVSSVRLLRSKSTKPFPLE